MQKSLGLWSLVGTGVGSIIGSGWLFSAYRTAKISGSGSIIAWLLGALIVLSLAFMIAEISTLHPRRGLFTRLLTLSHNRDMGYITALVNWLGMLAVIPTEAMATIQYLSSANAAWKTVFFAGGQLTSIGLAFSTALVIVYALLNFWGAKLFSKSNNILTIFKVLVPVGTALVILVVSFHPSNFVDRQHTLLPYGTGSIFAAIVGGGIIYAFNGFQTIVSFCAEAKDPAKTIPRALFITVFIGLAIYLLLQIAFIGGLPESSLEGGWNALVMQSPIVQLTGLLGLNFVSLMLYVDACISPSGTGIVYVGATSRMLTAMSQEKQAPKFFDKLHPVYHFSRRSLVFNILFSLSLLWFFPSWGALVVIVSLFHIISYMSCPLALMRLRIVEAKRTRKFKLPFAQVLCPVLFTFITLLFCSTPEKDLVLVTGVIMAFYSIYIVVSNQGNIDGMLLAVKRSYSLILYLLVLTGLGYLGNPKEGGLHLISHATFYTLMTITSLSFYAWIVYKPTCDQLPPKDLSEKWASALE